MGMTIEEAIRDLVYLKGCGIFPFNYGTDAKQLTIATDGCIAIAIETMRKYQKIEEIVEHWACCGNPSDSMIAISEVLEDGKND